MLVAFFFVASPDLSGGSLSPAKRFAIISFAHSDAPANALQAMLLKIEDWKLKISRLCRYNI